MQSAVCCNSCCVAGFANLATCFGAADGRELAYASKVLRPAEALLSHLAAVGFDPTKDRSVSRDNLKFISELMKRWGSKVPLTGERGQAGCRVFLRVGMPLKALLQTCRCTYSLFSPPHWHRQETWPPQVVFWDSEIPTCIWSRAQAESCCQVKVLDSDGTCIHGGADACGFCTFATRQLNLQVHAKGRGE